MTALYLDGTLTPVTILRSQLATAPDEIYYLVSSGREYVIRASLPHLRATHASDVAVLDRATDRHFYSRFITDSL